MSVEGTIARLCSAIPKALPIFAEWKASSKRDGIEETMDALKFLFAVIIGLGCWMYF